MPAHEDAMIDRRLEELRREIDAVDDQLVAVLADRAALVREVWALKRAKGLAMRDADREAAIRERALSRARARELHPEVLEAVLRLVVGRDLTQPLGHGNIPE